MIDLSKCTHNVLIIALGLGISSGSALAQMDVDQADSLNFEAFHKDKKEAVKVWKDDKAKTTETIKTYEQTTVPAANVAPAAAPAPAAASTAITANADKKGQRYELRERYTLARSAKTPYSAFYVIESLHQQSAKQCPKGWHKLAERSEAVEQDFYLYYQIECL